ncbi:PREDICTED: uncharacterized protein LOC104817632 [Tarenaya hassleriana]|uniref:uncharacterized protein LOC104817632 n=1 Tax=Tarenaya hassleriana TaxID=28532 RepID=UPI00053C4FF2|nr:PREDICTED: uncharacterized protein LOC104817632 [Tarenaya hassleriana]
MKLDETTSFPILEAKNKRSIKAKVVIGCDGSNSVVANFLQLNPTKALGPRVVRGFTSYPSGHGFPPEFSRIKIGNIVCGRIPVTDKLVVWLTSLHHNSQGTYVHNTLFSDSTYNILEIFVLK